MPPVSVPVWPVPRETMAFLQGLQQRVLDRKKDLFSPRRVVMTRDPDGEVGAATALLVACDAFTDFRRTEARQESDGDRIYEKCRELAALLRLRLDANEAKREVQKKQQQGPGFAFELHPRTAECYLTSCLAEHKQPSGLKARYTTRVSSDGFIVECEVYSADKSHSARTRTFAQGRQEAREQAAVKMLQLLGFGLPESH